MTAAASAAALAALAAWVGLGSPAGGSGKGPLPVASLTPGAVSTLTASELCAGARPSRAVTERVRQQVLATYGMQHASARSYELDALVTPELGGTTAPENLWPQRFETPEWNAYVKDALERLLADRVCRHDMPLAEAQRDLATDWVAAYKRHFHTEAPLPAHARAVPDDDALEFESRAPLMASL